MAYMNQEQKAEIAIELKKVIPKSWKYSLSVRHHSTIVLTIAKAPIDLLTMYGHNHITEHNIKERFDRETYAIFTNIFNALNLNNYDNSDPMSDYFNVGHYVDLNLGKWNKPFQVI